jgi:hypothetical protein
MRLEALLPPQGKKNEIKKKQNTHKTSQCVQYFI